MASVLRYFEHDGRSLTAEQWAAELGISYGTFVSRAAKGLPPEKLFARGKLTTGRPKGRKDGPHVARGHRITHDGVTRSGGAWAKVLGISQSAFSRRRGRTSDPARVFAVGPQCPRPHAPRGGSDGPTP